MITSNSAMVISRKKMSDSYPGKVFLIQVNGGFDFCYCHLPSCRFYNVDSLSQVNHITQNSTFIEITPELVQKFKSQAYLVISQDGFCLAEAKDHYNLQIIHGDNIIIEGSFIRSLVLPNMSRLCEHQDTDFRKPVYPKPSFKSCLPHYYLPRIYSGFENYLSPLSHAHVNLVCSDDLYYHYNDTFYTSVFCRATLYQINHTIICQVKPDTVYYKCTHPSEFSIIAISCTTFKLHVLVSHDSQSRILNIVRLTQPNMKTIMPDIVYNVLPYKKQYLSFDPLICKSLTTVNNNLKEFVAVLSKLLNSLDKKYHHVSSQEDCIVSNLKLKQSNKFPLLTPILPDFIILDGIRLDFISLFKVRQLIQQDQIEKCDLDLRLQPLVDKDSRNKIVTVYLRDGIICLVKAKFNSKTKKIYNPE